MMVSIVYPGGMLSTLPMTPKLRVPSFVALCQVFAAMKWLKGEMTMAAPSLSNTTMGPDCKTIMDVTVISCPSEIKQVRDDYNNSNKTRITTTSCDKQSKDAIKWLLFNKLLSSKIKTNLLKQRIFVVWAQNWVSVKEMKAFSEEKSRVCLFTCLSTSNPNGSCNRQYEGITSVSYVVTSRLIHPDMRLA